MKINIIRIDHVQVCIPIGKEDAARHFYAGILGLKEIEKPEALKKNGGLWFEMGNIQLHIGVEEHLNNSKRHPAFVVDDLEAIKAHLVKHKVKIKEDTPIPGVKRFSFYDPFNNRIEFVEYGNSIKSGNRQVTL